MHPVGHQRDQVQIIQAAAHQLSERGLGRGDEPAGDRRLRRGRGRLPHLAARGLQPVAITTGRQPGQHLLHRQLARDLGGGEQVIGRQVQLLGPVRSPNPRPGHREAPPAQGDRPSFGAMPVPVTLSVVLSARPAHPRHILVEHGGHDLQPSAGSQGQQTLPRRPGDLGHRHQYVLWHGDLAGSGSCSARRLFFWQVLLTAVPFLGRMTWRLPDTCHLAGHGRGTATLKFHEGRDILRRSVSEPSYMLAATHSRPRGATDGRELPTGDRLRWP